MIKKQKINAGFLLGVLVLIMMLPMFLWGGEALAGEKSPTGLFSFPQYTAKLSALMAQSGCGEINGTTIPCPQETMEKIMTEMQDELLGPMIKATLVSTVINTFQYVLDNLAYQSAVWIATGGEGETPLFDGRSANDAWRSFAEGVAGNAVGSLTEGLSNYLDLDLNLCAPPDPLFRASFALGIKSTFRPTQPKCDWQSIQSNWEGFAQTIQQTSYNPSEAILNEVAKGLRPGQNSLSYFVGANIKINDRIMAEQQNLYSEFLSNKGFQGVKDLVTGTTTTPASMVEHSFYDQIKAAQDGDLEAMKDAALQNTDILISLLKQTTSVFLTTLLENSMKKFKNGLLPVATYSDPFSSESSSTFGRAEAEEFYSDFISTTPSSIDSYSVLSQFVSCQSSSSLIRQANNCVMDSSMFDVVVRSGGGEGITVSQAISEGKLHGNWALYPPDDLVHNQDPFCYTYGYCYGNLVKLRKARIIPIGWEMAAASEQNSSSSPVTLSEVVAGFNDCNSDNKIDAEHPWCHLIDPNWVIKYPEQRCDASMIGEQLISADLAGRSGSCVDDPSCIEEDADGNCIGYGNCVREKNTWDFNGDSCPEQYATCMSFTNSETSDKNSWLFTTLDQGTCSSANAGCLWYRTNKNLSNAGTSTDSSDDTFEWLPEGEIYLTADREDDILSFTGTTLNPRTNYYYDDTDGDGVDESYNLYSFEDRIYLNSEVEYCSEESIGCSEVYPINDEVSLNLIRNASFEDDEDDDGVADFWTPSSTTVAYNESGSYSFNGTDSYYWSNAGSLSQGQIHLQPNRFYTLSFYAEGVDSTSGALLSLELKDSENNSIDLTGYSTDCDLDGTDTVKLATNEALGTGSFASYDCTFTTPSLDDNRAWIVGMLTISSTVTVYVDAIQLEVGEVPSDFHDEYNSTPIAEYMQLAPAWLGCEGKATDSDECDNFTQICSATEVGCSLYSPTDGDPDVPAIISSADLCPSECVGYATYKQEATDYDAEDFPLYFISDTARSCSSAYVGCDEFTNLETEAIEAFSYLRACVTPEMDAGEVFFTWEGSDATGYQLVSYLLLSSNLTSGDLIDYDSGEDDDTSPENAPCVSWEVTAADELTCAEDATTIATLAADDSCDAHEDILTNPDCREFYDSLGSIHYRLFSDTVSVSDDCTAYRKSDVDTTDADLDGYFDDCEYSGGFQTTAGECRYYIEPNESTTCSEEMAGCREYTGGSSRNSSSILTEYFEDGTYDDYTATSATLAISNESVAVDGHSLRVVTSSSAASVSVAPDNIVAGKTYVLKFWAKGTGSLELAMVDTGGEDDAHFFSDDPTELSTSWQLYEVGPLITIGEDFLLFDEDAVLSFHFSASGQTVYLDNIELVQTEEDLTLIKDSWVTPSTCDETAAGASSPQYYLGCEEYTDQNDNVFDVYQFSSLCSESVVGCEAFYDTKNSDSAYTQVFNASCYTSDLSIVTSATACYLDETEDEVCTIIVGRNNCQFDIDGDIPVPLPSNIVLGPETVYVPADEVVYLVEDSEFSCTSDNMGCTEVGIPTFSQDRTVVESFESTYILNQPDSFEDTLCDNDALFCAEWASTQDGNYYFKDPGDQDCEYKTGVSLNNVSYSGWFRSGTTQFCYGSGYCTGNTSTGCSTDAECAAANVGTCVINFGSYIKNGNESGIWYNGDTNFAGWAGTCSSQYDLCSEFIEPLATEEGNNDEGSSYFFLDNSAIAEENKSSTERCDGQVSLLDGCVLFNDTMDTNLAYSASASYLASEHADILFGEDPRSLQDSISCPDGGEFNLTTGSSVDLCANRCLYTVDSGSTIVNLWGEEASATQYLGAACVSDNDCQIGFDIRNREVEGDCVDISDDSVLDEYTLENDTNRVIKVYRDRQCAEWLACNSVTPAWDPKTNSWVGVCEDLGLCNDYSFSGEGFCSGWVTNDLATVLDSDRYSSRDVSWYGLDYSGYAIPDLLPVQFLDAYNIAPMGYCYNEDSIYEPLLGCDTGFDCRGIGAAASCVLAEDLPEEYSFDVDQWYLTYLAASCDGANGDSCTAGFCDDTGRSCSGDGECPTGDCIIGYCQAAYPDSYCSSGTDCADYGSGLVCENGTCVEIIYDADGLQETCLEDGNCSGASVSGVSDPECVPGVMAKTGTCYNGACLVAPNGQPLDITHAEEKACRGYPEIDSPFPPTKIVEAWLDPLDYATSDAGNDLDGPETLDSVPYDYVYGFRDAQVCAPIGSDADPEETDDCLCSYEKAKYGSGVTKRYYALETSRDDMLQGICSGGSFPGLACEDDAECETGGTCEKLTRIDTIYGWDGYCLERDISTQLYGSTDDADRTCLTWLPVDKLQGSRDAYANDTGAGYTGGDTYYCAEVGVVYDIKTSELACAETIAACNDGDWNSFLEKMHEDGDCASTVYCPDGFFAVMTGCGDLGHSSSEDLQCDIGLNDCPFICVPRGSYKTETDEGGSAGDACLNPSLTGFDVKEIFDASDYESERDDHADPLEADHDFKVYLVNYDDSGVTFLTNIVNYYDDCAVRGVTNSLNEFLYPDTTPFSIPSSHGGADGYYNLEMNIGAYAGCLSLIQTSSETADSSDGSYNKAWTERAWSSGLYSLQGDNEDYFGYSVTTQQEFFGRAFDPAFISPHDPYPQHAVVCTDEGEVDPEAPASFIPNSFSTAKADNSCDFSFESTTNPSGLDARTFVSVQGGVDPALSGRLAIGSSLCSDPSTCYCSSDADCNATVSCASDVCVNGLYAGNTCTSSESCYAASCFEDLSSDPQTSYCILNTGTVFSLTVGDYTNAREYLKQIFAKSYGWYSFTDGYEGIGDGVSAGVTSEWSNTGSYASIDLGDWEWDNTSEGFERETPTPPTIASVGLCYGSECLEQNEDKFSLNNYDSDDLSGSGGSFHATVSFFAYANNNQMPIRDVTVDWGDGENTAPYTDYAWPLNSQSGTQGDDSSYYKNRRGLIDRNTQYCSSADDEFGLSSNACTTAYFSFIHDYTCSIYQAGDGAGQAGILEACEWADEETGRLLNSPCTGGVIEDAENKCVYQPRVHVKDNWGWCTGECNAGAADGTDGCYDGGYTSAECDIELCPGGDEDRGACLDVGDLIANPWINYDGVIILDWSNE